MHTLHLPILGDKRIPLGTMVAQDGRRVEQKVELLVESARRVREETDAGRLVGVEVLSPGFCDKGVVDGDDEDGTGGFGLGAGEVAGDVGVGAAGAFWVVAWLVDVLLFFFRFHFAFSS